MTEQYFGFQIKAAGTSYAEFASPEPDGWDEWEQPDKYGDEYRSGMALVLPHQCSEWLIGSGTREQVIESAKAFRAELDAAITKLESEVSP